MDQDYYKRKGVLCWFYVYNKNAICGIVIIKRIYDISRLNLGIAIRNYSTEEVERHSNKFFYAKTKYNVDKTYENDDLIKKIIDTDPSDEDIKKIIDTESTYEDFKKNIADNNDKIFIYADYSKLNDFLKELIAYNFNIFQKDEDVTSSYKVDSSESDNTETEYWLDRLPPGMVYKMMKDDH